MDPKQNSLTARLQDFGGLVTFSHTIFLFPFALSAVVLAHSVRPVTVMRMVWIVVALVSARSAAMVMNRLADHKIDAKNPRTEKRPLVTGQVSRPQAWAYLIASSGIFILACWQLGGLTLWLSPIALAWVLGYSFSKRFTMLSHIWLGAATALAPLGAWIAVAGVWDWRAALFAGAVAFWVAGFDVIYACQDLEFDRGQGLHSIPARLGLGGALWVSRGMHLLAAAGFWAMAPLFHLGRIYLTGVVLVALLLVVEQILVAIKKANIPMAFFTVNGVVSIAFFLILFLDRLLEG